MDKKLAKGIIIVLGMHRSGTSAVAGCIAKLGAKTPSKLMPPTPDNPRGYWEALDLMHIHDRLLKSADLEWSDVSTFPEEWLQTNTALTFESAIKDFLEEQLDPEQLFVVKDPRICRIPELWFDLLRSSDITTRVVIPLRNPLEVANSLFSRDKMPIAVGCLLWLRHLLDAEKASRELPRAFLNYDSLLSHPKETLVKVSEALNLSWPAENWEDIEEFMEPNLRHHEAKLKDLAAEPQLSDLISRTYKHLQSLVESPNDAAAQAALDAIQLEVGACEQLFGPALEDKRKLSQQLKGELQESQASLSKLNQKNLKLEKQSKLLFDEKIHLQQTNLNLKQNLESSRAEQEKLKKHLKQKEAEIASHVSHAEKLNSEKKLLNDELSDLGYLYMQAYKQLEPLKFKEKSRSSSILYSLTRPLRSLGSKLRTKKQAIQLKELISGSDLFDSKWYLDKYKDVASSDMDALEHYISYGLTELRDPGPEFSVTHYIIKNPDIIGSGMHPLEHYILYGKDEGRAPKPT